VRRTGAGSEAEGRQVDLALERIHRHKTGALIRAAVGWAR
jgi:geranylgeranyl pyrophosphate synthase